VLVVELSASADLCAARGRRRRRGVKVERAQRSEDDLGVERRRLNQVVDAVVADRGFRTVCLAARR
jgi:hypothetical protein